jgi:hypothetical protein
LVKTDRGPRLVLIAAPLALIRLHPTRYALSDNTAEVSWRIESGLLVATTPASDGAVLRILARRERDARSPENALLHLTVEVEGYQPRLRGEAASRASAPGCTGAHSFGYTCGRHALL